MLLLPVSAGAAGPLDGLYARLQAAPGRAAAAALENRILAESGRALAPTTAVLLDDAHAASAAGDHNRAIADLDSAIDLQPDLGSLWRERGIAKLRAGDPRGAAADLGHAIDVDPHDFLAWTTLSLALEASGNASGAYAAWQKVIAIDPHAADAEGRLEKLRRKAQGERA